MYNQFFKLSHNPFSIAPDPRFLYMSERHREALAHLLYGVSGGGGFVLLTGEIGAGKTTVCRCFLEQIPDDCNVGYIFNPKLSVDELLKSICEEFHIELPVSDQAHSVKTSVDALNAFLLQAHAAGRHNVLIIDEAQGLSPPVLEQLRLLTNLETNERKLLQIILIGQPELRVLLEQPELRQLAQRVIARYHLDSLSAAETANYVAHRLAVAGIGGATPLPDSLMKTIHQMTQGVPRRINLLCDRALLGAYAEGKTSVNRKILQKAAREVFGDMPKPAASSWRTPLLAAMGGAALVAGTLALMPLFGDLGQKQISTMSKPAQEPAIAAQVPAKPAASKPIQVSPPSPPSLPTFQPGGDVVLAEADLDHAYRALAGLWGQSLAEGDPCTLLQQTNLRCYQSTKGFAEIRQLNRPAILFLHDANGHAYHALLSALTDTQATLRLGATTYSATVLSLMPYFHGEFATIWRAPPDYREQIHPGDKGLDIDWLAARLAKLNGTGEPEPGSRYDSAMMQQVRAFQLAQGLNADGVVGPKTIMQLVRAGDSAEPRLMSGAGLDGNPDSSRK
ncbi:MAG TPA: AAA family ATPase [Burkholderiaceae bacterium]|jgi:general secretion pathway protein A